MARFDGAKEFTAVGAGLIPSNETIRCALRALPRDEGHRRSTVGASADGIVTVPNTPAIAIDLEGQAASWPHQFARHPSQPGCWSEDVFWFFWVVFTDKNLHVFEGHYGERPRRDPLKAGGESATYPLTDIDEMAFKKRLGISDLSIWFKDGSVVRLDVGRQKFDALEDVLKMFERPGSQRKL